MFGRDVLVELADQRPSANRDQEQSDVALSWRLGTLAGTEASRYAAQRTARPMSLWGRVSRAPPEYGGA